MYWPWILLLHDALCSDPPLKQKDISPEDNYPTHSESRRITLSTFFSPPQARVSEDGSFRSKFKEHLPVEAEDESAADPLVEELSDQLKNLSLAPELMRPAAIIINVGNIAVRTPRSVEEFRAACEIAATVEANKTLVKVWEEQANRIVLLTSVFGHHHTEFFFQKTKSLILDPDWHFSYMLGISQQKGVVFENGIKAWLNAFPELLSKAYDMGLPPRVKQIKNQERRIMFRLIAVYEAMMKPDEAETLLKKIDQEIFEQQPRNAVLIVLYFGDVTGCFRRFQDGDEVAGALLKKIADRLAAPPHSPIFVLETIVEVERKTVQPLHFSIFLQLYQVDAKVALSGLAKRLSPVTLCVFMKQYSLEKSFVLETLGPWEMPRLSAEAYFEILERRGDKDWLPNMRAALSCQSPRLLLGIAFMFLHLAVGIPLNRLAAPCREPIDIHTFVYLINMVAEQKGSSIRLNPLSLDRALELTAVESVSLFWEAFAENAPDLWTPWLEDSLSLIDDQEKALTLALNNNQFVIFSRLMHLIPDARTLAKSLWSLAVELKREEFCLFLLHHWGDLQMLELAWKSLSTSFQLSVKHLFPFCDPDGKVVREVLQALDDSMDHLKFDSLEQMNGYLWTSLVTRYHERERANRYQQQRLEEMAQMIFSRCEGKTPWDLIHEFDTAGHYGLIVLILVHLQRTGQYSDLDVRVRIPELGLLTRIMIRRNDIEERLMHEEEFVAILDMLFERRRHSNRPLLHSSTAVKSNYELKDQIVKDPLLPVAIAYHTFDVPLLDWLMVKPKAWPSSSLVDCLNYLISRLTAFYAKRPCVRFFAHK